MTRILIIEDEPSFVEALEFLLSKEGFTVEVASSGDQGLTLFERNGYDLVLLDLMLPGMSGVEVCKEIRKSSSVPIIMLTAKDDEIDKVIGLELGADDYVTKPYSARELVARIRAVLRRGAAIDAPTDGVLSVNQVTLDSERHQVRISGNVVPFPLKEFDLLEMLLRNAGRVLTQIGRAHV